MTVFEVSNDKLKEFYLCASALPLAELMREHCDRPPKAIAHWRKDHGVFYGVVEEFKGETDVKAFMGKYKEVLARTGWTVLVEG